MKEALLYGTQEKTLQNELYEVLNPLQHIWDLWQSYKVIVTPFGTLLEWHLMNTIVSNGFLDISEIVFSRYESIDSIVKLKKLLGIGLIELAHGLSGLSYVNLAPIYNYGKWLCVFKNLSDINSYGFPLTMLIEPIKSFMALIQPLKWLFLLADGFNIADNEENRQIIFSYQLKNKIDTIYGSYLESDNSNPAKSFYIILEGEDFSSATTQNSYLKDILIKKGYNVINIDAKSGHKYDMQKVYELTQQHLPEAKLEGFIISGHGGYTEEGISSLLPHHEPMFLQCSPIQSEKKKYTHNFVFNDPKFAYDDYTIGTTLVTEEVLTELYQYFKSQLSDSFEFQLSSCQSGAIDIEKVLEIIPETACFFAGAKNIGQNMLSIGLGQYQDFIKMFLLSNETECLIVEEYNDLHYKRLNDTSNIDEPFKYFEYEYQYYSKFTNEE